MFCQTIEYNNMIRTFNLWILLIVSLGVIIICYCDKLSDPDSEEITDLLDIPDYYFENNYLENRTQAILEAINDCSDDYDVFFWITDIHWESKNNTRLSPSLIKYIASKTKIDKIINGGDNGNSKNICKNAISILKKAIGSDRVYSVTGNHEMYDASGYEKPYERVAEELRGHNSDIVYGDTRKSYFYFDNAEGKVRYVGLSSYGQFVNGDHESCYTKEQLDWFKNTALNVKSGWHIVIFSHSLYYVSCATDNLCIGPLGASDFINAIEYYKGDGIISCVLLGHTHRDRIHIGRMGVPYIISASDRFASYKGDINVERIPGTISEQHFEVIILDKIKRQLKLFSIGGFARDGYDNDPGKNVDVRIVNF